LKRNQSQ